MAFRDQVIEASWTSRAERYRRPGVLALILAVGLCRMAVADTTAVEILRQEAVRLKPLVFTEPAMQFLDAVADLPEVSVRTAYVNAETRKAISPAEYEALTDSTKRAYKIRELDGHFYYNTRYGTPLAFVRALDLSVKAGLAELDGARIADFGFGSIGQLRLMASLGAEAHGIEVDPLLPLLYSQVGDTGAIAPSDAAKATHGGRVVLNFGQYPADSAVRAKVGDGYDLFISKNTLKRGYIHPSREADPRMLVHLGVDDSTFVSTVYRMLKTGGVFMIYNLHPAEAKPDEKYVPWADGRCPFERALLEKIGFTVIAYDKDDTEFAHTMAKALGWDAEMDLAKDLFGHYTVVRK